MIFLYTFLLLTLGTVKVVVDRRVASLERKYARTAKEADRLLGVSFYKEGNTNRYDPGQTAKQQYLLGLLVQKKDRLETKHLAWQEFAEKVDRFVRRLRNWKGKKLPYTLGVVDVSCVLYLIDYLGVGEYVSLKQAMNLVNSLFTG